MYEDAYERTTDPEDFVRTFQGAGVKVPKGRDPARKQGSR